MNKNIYCACLIMTFLLGSFISAAPSRTPTPTPTPTPLQKKNGAAAVHRPTPIKIGKGKTETSKPSPIRIIKMDVATPTPTPYHFTSGSDPGPTATITPTKIPKLTTGGARPGPISGITPPPGPTNPNKTQKKSNGTKGGSKPARDASKLRIYTKNGWATSSTNLSGEIPAQLAVYAMVHPESNDFALQWTRFSVNIDKEEKGNLYITHPGESQWLAVQAVSIPAGTRSVNIPYSIKLAPAIYELLIAADSGNSNRVKVSFGGTGTDTTVKLPAPGSAGTNPPPAAAAFTVTLTHFKPMKGTPGPSGYTHPRLIYSIKSTVDMPTPPLEFAVDSAPFTDPSSITASGPASYPPLRLFEKQKKGGTAQLKAGKASSFYVDLDATPADPHWFLAYGANGNATFRWSSGGAGGSAEHPVQTKWP